MPFLPLGFFYQYLLNLLLLLLHLLLLLLLFLHLLLLLQLLSLLLLSLLLLQLHQEILGIDLVPHHHVCRLHLQPEVSPLANCAI